MSDPTAQCPTYRYQGREWEISELAVCMGLAAMRFAMYGESEFPVEDVVAWISAMHESRLAALDDAETFAA